MMHKPNKIITLRCTNAALWLHGATINLLCCGTWDKARLVSCWIGTILLEDVFWCITWCCCWCFVFMAHHLLLMANNVDNAGPVFLKLMLVEAMTGWFYFDLMGIAMQQKAWPQITTGCTCIFFCCFLYQCLMLTMMINVNNVKNAGLFKKMAMLETWQ